MGRRSTKTTKTGKFMNPTDQWRKQIRKKELKKNKQQRTAVREAVLKNKNPITLLSEIEEIEKMEIEAGSEEVLPAEKGLKEKKRKLHETLQRIILYHERQNPDEAKKIKALVAESEKKRRAMSKVYNSYKTARSQISLSDIPLPEGTSASEDTRWDSMGQTSPSSLNPPGPPPGLPPDLVFPPVITYDELYPPEEEKDQEQEEEEPEADDNSSEEEEEEEEEHQRSEDEESDNDESQERIRPPPPPPGLPPGYSVLPHPLPLFPPSSQFPPPPSLQPPPHEGSTNRFRPPPPLFNKSSPHIQSSPMPSSQTANPVISAQPQLRNVQAEVTKFMPTSLRVRRDQPKGVKAKLRTAGGLAGKGGEGSLSNPSSSSTSRPGIQGDAYKAFMEEMQGLL